MPTVAASEDRCGLKCNNPAAISSSLKLILSQFTKNEFGLRISIFAILLCMQIHWQAIRSTNFGSSSVSLSYKLVHFCLNAHAMIEF